MPGGLCWRNQISTFLLVCQGPVWLLSKWEEIGVSVNDEECVRWRQKDSRGAENNLNPKVIHDALRVPILENAQILTENSPDTAYRIITTHTNQPACLQNVRKGSGSHNTTCSWLSVLEFMRGNAGCPSSRHPRGTSSIPIKKITTSSGFLKHLKSSSWRPHSRCSLLVL